MLDNFHVRYVVQPGAGHWFENAQVSTVYVVVQRVAAPGRIGPTRFVTLRKPLDDFRAGDDTPAGIIGQVAALYDAVDTCDRPLAPDWRPDPAYSGAYDHRAGLARVSVVPRQRLLDTLAKSENWEPFFVAADMLAPFQAALRPVGAVMASTGRGRKVDFDGLFLLDKKTAAGIEPEFLLPALHDSDPLTQIHHTAPIDTYFFVCDKPLADLHQSYPGAYGWVKKWARLTNKKGVANEQAYGNARRAWYTMSRPQPAPIFITMGPYKQLYFSYADHAQYLNQRLVALRPAPGANVPLLAALLNSVVTLLEVERSGNARNLGVLDLNADYFQTRIRMLDPTQLDAAGITSILTAFAPLSKRPMMNYDQEFQQADRQVFDAAVFQAFGFAPALLPPLYKMLTDLMENRVTRKDK